jgi:hypothetical protein
MQDFCCFETVFYEGRVTWEPVFYGSCSFIFPVLDVDEEGESILCENV